MSGLASPSPNRCKHGGEPYEGPMTISGVAIELWESRTSIANAERLAFSEHLAVARNEETRKRLDSALGSLNALDRAAVARRAIHRVLIELDYLLVRKIANWSTLDSIILSEN